MAGNNPASAFPSAPPRFFDNGAGAKLLQPDNQIASIATIATNATGTAISVAVNAVIAALNSAGIVTTV